MCKPTSGDVTVTPPNSDIEGDGCRDSGRHRRHLVAAATALSTRLLLSLLATKVRHASS